MGLLKTLKGKAMGAILATLVKKLAEGDFGQAPARAYWWLAGKKTWTAVALASIAGGLFMANANGLCDPCHGYAMGIITAAGVLASIGLFDAAVRITPPTVPPFVRSLTP